MYVYLFSRNTIYRKKIMSVIFKMFFCCCLTQCHMLINNHTWSDLLSNPVTTWITEKNLYRFMDSYKTVLLHCNIPGNNKFIKNLEFEPKVTVISESYTKRGKQSFKLSFFNSSFSLVHVIKSGRSLGSTK